MFLQFVKLCYRVSRLQWVSFRMRHRNFRRSARYYGVTTQNFVHFHSALVVCFHKTTAGIFLNNKTRTRIGSFWTIPTNRTFLHSPREFTLFFCHSFQNKNAAIFVTVTTVTMVRGYPQRVVTKYGSEVCFLAISLPPGKYGQSGKRRTLIILLISVALFLKFSLNWVAKEKFSMELP